MIERKQINSLWFNSIPKTWNDKKFKYVTDFLNGYAFKSDDYVQEGIPVIRIGDVKPIINLEETKKLPEFYLESAKEYIIKKNDILLALTGATIGKSCIYYLDEPALLNQRVAAIRPLNEIENSFLKYLIDSKEFKSFINYECDGGAQENIGKGDISNFLIPIPPKEEQTAIANYLDEKTARIDKLIANKQKLIELLKEKRTAIINQAVTKGIDPNVKLKPSGIEWLGDIPEHWEIKKLKYVANIKYGLGQPPNQKSDGLPLLRATNIERGKINEKDLIFVDPDDIPYDRDPVLKENDIIVVRSGAYTADSAIIPKKYEGAITGYDMVVRAISDNPLFVSYCLLSNYVLINQLYLQRLRAAQPHLNKEELGESFFLIPKKVEQDEIVEYLEMQTQQIDNTISKIEKEIELLQEYRTALISEVVTGKIKVI